MDMTTATMAVMEAASGMTVAVNTCIRTKTDDGTIDIWGNKAKLAGYAAMFSVAEVYKKNPYKLREPFAFGVRDFGTGVIRIFSEEDGPEAIKGYHDFQHMLFITVDVQGEMEEALIDLSHI